MKTVTRGEALRSADGVVAETAEPAGESRTREAVVRLLLADGPLTVPVLAARLGLTAAGLRRHLDQLQTEGAVTSRPVPQPAHRGRGRPPRAYLLTDVGRARLPHNYDELAVSALAFLAETAGAEQLSRFARERAESIVAGAGDRLAAAPDLAGKVEVLADAFTDRGYAASVRQVGVGVQLCQHHCPVGAVASRFPVFCEEEFAVVSRALGTYGQRLATIARGDSFCTTFLPLTAVRTPADRHVDRPPTGQRTQQYRATETRNAR